MWCTSGAGVVQEWCSCGARVMKLWCTSGAGVVHEWCRCGARVVQVWCSMQWCVVAPCATAVTDEQTMQCYSAGDALVRRL